MAGCFFSILDSSYWFRATAEDGTFLGTVSDGVHDNGARPLSATVTFDPDTGEILTVEFECHPDVPPEIKEQVARVFLHLDLCFDLTPP